MSQFTDQIAGMMPRAGSRRTTLTSTTASEAGVLAAMLMLAVQLFWRLNQGGDGVVPAFPEFIVTAIARLTPMEVFGAATENYGSLAKKTLFVAVLLGVIAIGAAAGAMAGRISRDGGLGRRLLGIGAVTAGLYLVTGLVILPIAYLGAFGVDSSHTGEIQTQLLLTFALFAVAWVALSALLAADRERLSTGQPSGTVSRRTVLGRGTNGLVSLVLTAAVGAMAWRIVGRKVSTVDEAEADAAAEEIAANARAQETPGAQAGAAPGAAATPSPAAGAPTDPAAIFAELDSSGRLTPVLTSVADFYHVSKNLVDPEVDPSGWKLTIGGKVEKELTYTLEQLTALATTRKITTLGCISNQLNGDLVGTAEWQAVPLAQLLAEAQVQPGVIDLKFHAADDYQDSIPLARGMDPDTMVVVGMNGAPLTSDHGAPARMIVPGIYGMKNVKWLDRIEAVDEDFQGFWQTRGWSDTAEYQIWARIDWPGGKVPPGQNVACGMASAGDRGVARVEISLDDGETWADAILEPAINPPFTWVRWAFPFDQPPGKYELRVRATDGAGTVAPEAEADPLPDGATGWPKRIFVVTES